MSKAKWTERLQHASSSARVVLALLAVPLVAAAQVNPCTASPSARVPDSTISESREGCWLWSTSHDGTDWTTRVRELRDGSIVAVGFINRDTSLPDGWQAFAARLSADGSPIWTRSYGAAGIDAFWDTRELGNGELVAVGFTDDGAAGWVAWLDASTGDLLRERRLSEAGPTRLLGAALSPNGGIHVVGEVVPSGRSARDVYAAYFDADGSLVWERTFGESASTDRAFFVQSIGDGLVLTGVTGAPDGYDLLTVRLDHQGRVVWQHVHGGPGNDPNHGLAIRADGRIVVAGYTNSGGVDGAHDIVALVYDDNGRLESHAHLRAPGDDRVMSIEADTQGGVWFAGYSTSFTTGDWDVLVARLAPDGRFEPWLSTIGTRADDSAYAIALARNGDLLLGGYGGATDAGPRSTDLLVLRVDPARLTRHAQGVAVTAQ